MTATDIDSPIGRVLRDVVDAAGAPDGVVEQAEDVLSAVDNDGGYVDSGVPAAVYVAIRLRGDPVKPDEVADAAGVDSDRLLKDTRRLIASTDFELPPGNGHDRFVARYCDELGVDDDVRRVALDLCDDAIGRSDLHVGKAPSVFAAACVYASNVVLDRDLTQAAVADVAGVSTTIIRRHYRDIIDVSPHAAKVGGGSTLSDLPQIVDRIVSSIDGSVPDVAVDDAGDMADAIDDDTEWARRCDPSAVAAAVVYVAAKRHRLDITQAEVADVAGVSRHAVNARSQDVREWDTRRRLQAANYNRLKELAERHGVDVGKTPAKVTLVDKLAGAGVSV